jgi:hypothetical protein
MEKNLNQLTKNCSTFLPKKLSKALRNMGWRSGIRDPEKTYTGSRVKKAP